MALVITVGNHSSSPYLCQKKAIGKSAPDSMYVETVEPLSGHCDSGCHTASVTCIGLADALIARDVWMLMTLATRVKASVTTLAATQAR